MKQRVNTLLLVLVVSIAAGAQSLWDTSHLEYVKQHIGEPFYNAAYREMKAEADSMLALEPLSVMMKSKVPVSGDMHDYLSQARYAWPDPSKTDGKPYIHRDGESNPEIETLDRIRLGEAARRISTLSKMWYFSADERYAAKAVEQIREWFINPATRMNPHLRYAQVVPGDNGDEGRCYGIIDTYSLVDMLSGVQMLASSRSLTHNDDKQLRRWFGRLLQWMLTSRQGKQEAEAANNHSIAYDAQVLAYALYTGRKDVAQKMVGEFVDRRLMAQINADGSQPHELGRTLSFHYSWYNLSHAIDFVLMARNAGYGDMVDWPSRIVAGVDYLMSYVGKPQAAWPYKQIAPWHHTWQQLLTDAYRVGLHHDTYRQYRMLNLADHFNLMYYHADNTDNMMAAAMQQMEHAVEWAGDVPAEGAEAGDIIPRSLNADGSIKRVGANDWCSGFFAGSLWAIYEYTHDDRWRHCAEKWTAPVEKAKRNGGTHDLGFMINNSFGRGYELTGDTAYRNVVIEASRTLITRFNPNVGCIRSWDFNRDKWDYPVIIDNMMNLEMLFRATQLTGDSVFWNVAVSHANTTMRNHFRQDASSFHVVDYNPVTGEVRGKCTFQGNADDSFWSRGQAWGLYGFTMCYRFTRDNAYLAHARRIAHFILTLPGMPEDGIPYWDMKLPTFDGAPRDVSAAAIAASALYELSGYVEPQEARRYRAAANRIVTTLYKSYSSPEGENQGFLLLHSTGHMPGKSEIDVPLNYADYYYLEALLKQLKQK